MARSKLNKFELVQGFLYGECSWDLGLGTRAREQHGDPSVNRMTHTRTCMKILPSRNFIDRG